MKAFHGRVTTAVGWNKKPKDWSRKKKLNQKDKAISHYDAIITMKSAKPDRWAIKEAQKFKRALQWSQN